MEHDNPDQMDCQQSTSTSCHPTEERISTLDPTPTSLNVRHTHQLSPRNLLTAMVDEEEQDQGEEHTIQNASIACEIEEPDEKDMTDSSYTYLSIAAIQIRKAIGAQEALSEYDDLRIKLKSKTKPSHQEWKKYISLLSQLHTLVLSTKYKQKWKLKKSK